MTTTKIRTRIAPSPTGFLHLGTARTALYSWAYARHFGGAFVLRIEDTDVARSTQDSVTQILASMKWLGLEYDEGPVYQMQRLGRYKAVVDQLVSEGKAYYCYSTPEELDAVREAKKARGEKALYDGRWRPTPGKTLPLIPKGVKPVVRFCNPPDGEVTWNDLVKGPITISNRELDDLIIVRTDGIPTYNFAVVVDDWDMQISHVFRGDEHINNTPWQINIFNALSAPLPLFGHCPVILGDDGQKLSKRRGAVSVTAYEEGGYLPEAMLNYLARLGWSHGDEELFTREQLVGWFDGTHLNKSAAQWDPAKLLWVNAHYIKQADNARLAKLVAQQLVKLNVVISDVVVDTHLPLVCALLKDRCDTTVALATWAATFYAEVTVDVADKMQYVTDAVKPALQLLAEKLATCAWDKASIGAVIKEVLAATGLKMPQLAMPVRVLVVGTTQTPSIDAVLELIGKEKVVARLAAA
ncbi:MAG: glutamate--tRNA ligase [Candidatus Saccharibacteria bacterium]|nr:glutamate--tRNA ligase [Rhodoferax sp.]